MVLKLKSKKYEHLSTFIERISNINFSLLKMRKIGQAIQIKDMFGNYHSNQTLVVGGIALNISLAGT